MNARDGLTCRMELSRRWASDGFSATWRSYCSAMLPLAVSGRIVIAVAVIGAILLLLLLFRFEDRYEAEQDRERRR